VPLHLTLHAVPATRTPNATNRFRFGGQLRLPGGPVLDDDDPLLKAFAAHVLQVRADGAECALQLDAFAPGRRVELEIEYDEDGDSVVGVWDAERVRRAGVLPFRRDCALVAAIDHGLMLEAVVLREFLDASDLQRQTIDVFVHARAFVHVEVPDEFAVDRPQRQSPRRVVLLADGSGEVGFWDAAGDAGPAGPDDLPLSGSLATELKRLRAKYCELAQGDDDATGMEEMERGWTRESLDHRATILWRRARQELGRRYAVGFQGPGMEKPVWSPQDLVDQDDDEYSDMPF